MPSPATATRLVLRRKSTGEFWCGRRGEWYWTYGLSRELKYASLYNAAAPITAVLNQMEVSSNEREERLRLGEEPGNFFKFEREDYQIEEVELSVSGQPYERQPRRSS